jgi:hypothetical protein
LSMDFMALSEGLPLDQDWQRGVSHGAQEKA